MTELKTFCTDEKIDSITINSNMIKKIPKTDVEHMFAHPAFCVPKIDGWGIEGGKAPIEEDVWIREATIAIKEMGTEKWLRCLLDNLKNNKD